MQDNRKRLSCIPLAFSPKNGTINLRKYLPKNRFIKTTKDTKAAQRARRMIFTLCVLREYFVTLW